MFWTKMDDWDLFRDYCQYKRLFRNFAQQKFKTPVYLTPSYMFLMLVSMQVSPAGVHAPSINTCTCCLHIVKAHQFYCFNTNWAETLLLLLCFNEHDVTTAAHVMSIIMTSPRGRQTNWHSAESIRSITTVINGKLAVIHNYQTKTPLNLPHNIQCIIWRRCKTAQLIVYSHA